MAWGNLTGIRVEGQLMEFETSLNVVGKDWVSVTATGKEKQQPKYHREGETQNVNTSLGGIKFVQSVRENGTGSAIVDIRSIAQKDTLIEGVYFCIDIPGEYYSDGTVRINGSSQRQAISALCSDGDKLRKVLFTRSAKSVITKFIYQYKIYLSYWSDGPRIIEFYTCSYVTNRAMLVSFINF